MVSHRCRDSRYLELCQQQAVMAVQVRPPIKQIQVTFLVQCMFRASIKRQDNQTGNTPKLYILSTYCSDTTMKKRLVCGSVCTLIFLALTIFAIFGLQSLVDSAILDSVRLTPDTYDLWGANPGSSNITTSRNFTFYNFTNPQGYLYRGETPKFTEMSNFFYQQRSNFTDLTYNEDSSIINFNYWLYFTIMDQSRDVNEYVNVINLAPLGFWHQLDLVDASTFAIQGFGSLFLAMNETIIIQAIGQGVSGQYLKKEEDWSNLCLRLEIEQKLCHWIWADPFFGLGNQNLYEPWVRWLYLDQIESGDAIVNYFGLNNVNLEMLKKLFKEWAASVDNILDDWYCQGQTCSAYDLTIRQLGRAGLTADPPSGDPMDSICQSGNITCKGFPELYAYYKNVFLNDHHEDQYKNLTFSDYTVSQLFSPNNGTLLNVGNLSNLYMLGRLYDQSPTNISIINALIIMTHAESKQHAVVVWKYVNYFVDEFVLKKSQGGGGKHAGLAGVFSQAFYESITSFADWIMPELGGLLIAEAMGNCSNYLQQHIETIATPEIKRLCANVSAETYRNYYHLAEHCQNPLLRLTLKQKFNISTQYAISSLCDANQPSLSSLFLNAHAKLSSMFNCTVNPTNRCTAFQLSAKQFFNSQITLNPLKSTIKQYQKSISVKDWNPMFEQFQYRKYLQIAFGDPWIDGQKFDDNDRIASVLSFDKFYSVPGVQDLLLERDADKLREKYYFKNQTLLKGYIRYLTIEVGFGGLTQKRTANELLFGYEDPFLKQLKEMDPMLGGDPSIEAVVMMNQPNSTIQDAVNKPQSMYTGYDDWKLTRNYITDVGYPYITYNNTYFTGYKVVSEQINPFASQEYLHGTDAVMNHPMSTPEISQFVYLDTLYRVAQMDYDQPMEKFGFDVLKYKVSNKTIASCYEEPQNSKFYQYERGLFNVSFLGVPALVSKNHFLSADPKWMDRVEIYDEKGENRQYPNQFDQSYLILQPKSGATFSATVFLQNNFNLIPDDVLFPQLQNAMLPIMSVFRSANLTQEAADDVLGDLKIALAAPRKVLLFSVVGLLISVAASSCCFYIVKKDEVRSQPSLLQSTDNALPQPQPVVEVRLEREEEQRDA